MSLAWNKIVSETERVEQTARTEKHGGRIMSCITTPRKERENVRPLVASNLQQNPILIDNIDGSVSLQTTTTTRLCNR